MRVVSMKIFFKNESNIKITSDRKNLLPKTQTIKKNV